MTEIQEITMNKELRTEKFGIARNPNSQLSGITDESKTATGSYATNEQDMLNSIKAKLNSALAALRNMGLIDPEL